MNTSTTDIAVEGITQVPDHYRKHAWRSWDQRRRLRNILSMLRNARGMVLDYGCGYGDVTHAVAKTHDVVGVDADRSRIAFALREYAPIQFRLCDHNGLDFADESFDVVLSSAVVHSVPDPMRYFQEVRRVLRKDGYLILVCPNVQVVLQALRRLLGRPAKPSSKWVRTESEVRDTLHSLGFRVEAATHFYDPPFVSWKNMGDVLVGIIEQALALLRVRKAAGFCVLLVRKTGETGVGPR